MFGVRSVARLLAILLVVGTTVRAGAQAPPAEDAEAPPAADPPPAEAPAEGEGAADAAAPDAAPAPAPPPAPVDPVFEEAKQHFLQGRALADSGNCSGAIVEFQAAFELTPRPSALYNIAQCQERLFRYDLAIRFYERFLEIAPQDDPDRGAVEGAIRLLSGLLATVAISSNVEAEVWVGDRLAGKAPGEVLLPGGSYVVELRASGYEPERREISVVGKQHSTLSFELRELATYSGISPVYFWGTAGVSLVLLGVGGVFGVQAVAESSDAGSRDPELNTMGTVEDIQDKQLLADVFFGAAGAVAVGATVLYFLTDWDADPSEAGGAEGARLQPVIGPDGAGLLLRGTL